MKRENLTEAIRIANLIQEYEKAIETAKPGQICIGRGMEQFIVDDEVLAENIKELIVQKKQEYEEKLLNL